MGTDILVLHTKSSEFSTTKDFQNAQVPGLEEIQALIRTTVLSHRLRNSFQFSGPTIRKK